MTFSWTQHRFSGGALAFDVANSVVLRHERDRRTDRFAEHGALDAFPDAAQRFCAERFLFEDLKPVPPSRKTLFLDLREAIDGYFRACVMSSGDNLRLARLLEAAANVLRQGGPEDVDTATAHSALRLIGMAEPQRMKICGNCGWLFIDRSKNRSRAWCDMAVCGNRVKAVRHYRRRREEHP